MAGMARPALAAFGWHDLSATPVGDEVYLIRAVVRNSGWLPSYVTKLAAEKKLVRGVICELNYLTARACCKANRGSRSASWKAAPTNRPPLSVGRAA